MNITSLKHEQRIQELSLKVRKESMLVNNEFYLIETDIEMSTS
jgi:hypothetical protein